MAQAEDLTKHTMFLRTGDYERIGAAFPKQRAAYVIRRLISRFVDGLDQPSSRAEAEELLQDEGIQI